MITVAICTYNRAEQLRAVLTDLSAQSWTGSADDEVLIVDNNSRDATPEVAAAFRTQLPIRYVREHRQGISAARNRAIQEARGAVLVFLDDDVRVMPEWLAAYKAAFADPSVMVAGGRIIAKWPSKVPRWCAGEVAPPFSTIVPHFDLGDSELDLSDPDHIPVTANIGFRTEVIRALGGFREDLGSSGTILLGNEDMELLIRTLERHSVIRYLPRAVVEHPVEPKRLSLWFNFRYLHGGGIGQSRYLPVAPGTRMLLGAPAWAWRKIATAIGAGGWRLLSGNLRGAAVEAGRVAVMTGYIRGVRANNNP